MRLPPPIQQKFHRAVFFPKVLKEQCRTAIMRLGGEYEVSEHAAERAWEKGVRLPDRIPLDCDIIEATFTRKRLEKMLVRFRQDAQHDIVLGLTVEGCVTTVYLNSRFDRHHTLRREEYARRVA